MADVKKFISPKAWFSMVYPAGWCEAEDGEGSFLFYNPEVWDGNFRISAYKEELSVRNALNYGKEGVQQELKENPGAKCIRLGQHTCAFSQEEFEEEDQQYVSYLWIVGIENMLFECTFTVQKGTSARMGEEVVASLEVRRDGEKYPAEIIPVRLSEIYLINESYEWTADLVKKQLSLDFQGVEADLEKIQQVIDSGVIGRKKRDEWLALGIVVCVIMANEVEGLQWMTLIDGNREAPVLVYQDGTVIDPMKLVWSKVKAGEPCQVVEAYQNALN